MASESQEKVQVDVPVAGRAWVLRRFAASPDEFPEVMTLEEKHPLRQLRSSEILRTCMNALVQWCKHR